MIRRLVQSQIRLFIDIDIVHVFKLTSVELKECNVREEILDVASSEQKKRIEKNLEMQKSKIDSTVAA